MKGERTRGKYGFDTNKSLYNPGYTAATPTLVADRILLEIGKKDLLETHYRQEVLTHLCTSCREDRRRQEEEHNERERLK